jgi:hypothetical protein
VGPLPLGATLGQKYRVIRLMAETGGLVLYEATDTAHARRVWIKILPREALTNADALARFQTEAAGAKVLDVGKSDDGLPYLVATDFASPAGAPPLPRKGPKSTLRGVAPPPPPMPRPQLTSQEDDRADDGVLAPTPVPLPIPVEVATIPVIEEVAEAPAVAPPIQDDVLLRERKKRRARTVVIRTQRPSYGWVWAVVLVAIAGAAGVGGWYLGHRQTNARATVVVPHDLPPPSSDPSTQPEPAITPPPPVATATVTASDSTHSAAGSATVVPPPPPTHVRRRPPAAPHTNNDPLTL